MKRSLVLVLLSQALLPAQTPPSETLLVLSKADNSLATIDPHTLKVLARVPVGQDPHEVIASSDGKLAYVSNYGGGSGTTIAVVDLVNQKALPPIDLGSLRGAHGLTFVAGKLWFTAEGAKVIGSYDPATRKIDWVLGTGQNRTHMIFVSPDLKRIVTANVSSGTMSIIEKTTVMGRGGPGPGGPPPGGPGRGAPKGPPPGGPRTDWEQTVIPVGKGPEGFDVSPDGKEIWAANAQDGTVSIIDVAGRKVTQTLDANVRGANRLKFTLDGKLVLVSTLGGADVTLLDASTHQPVKRIPIGHGAAGVLMHPDGSRVYVACTPDNYVTIIDLKSLEVTGHLEAGGQPDGLAWAVRR
jgi:YVTN family beta-propeller protein